MHGSIPNNGLVVSEMPEIGFRLRIFCRSDSMLENIGQFIGPDGTNVNNNSFFATAHPQPGEMAIENIVGIHSVLTATQQGMYTCRIPTHNGEIREINIGIYPAGFSGRLCNAKISIACTMIFFSYSSPYHQRLNHSILKFNL